MCPTVGRCWLGPSSQTRCSRGCFPTPRRGCTLLPGFSDCSPSSTARTAASGRSATRLVAYPPSRCGGSPLATTRTRKRRPCPLLAGYLAAVGGAEHAARVGAGLSRISEFLPHQRYAYLNVLGVEPSRQRTGVGTVATSKVIDAAAGAALPVHLETTNPVNVAWYERLGFEVVGDTRLGEDGPELWAMTRAPGPAFKAG